MKTNDIIAKPLVLLFLVIFPYLVFSQDHEMISKVKGSWVGKLKVQGIELTLVINVTANDKDSLGATIDSPDQGAKGLPTSGVTLKDDSLIIRSKALMGAYKGIFNADFTRLTGTWFQNGMSFPLELNHQEAEFTLNRPQEPKPPYPYIAKEVTIRNAEAGVDLAGTLTMPGKGGPFPAIILVSGSGAQNRDEEIMGHKPFLLLADHFTRNGFAVLRYDDRGYGNSTGNFSTATTLDFAKDASAAVDFLKSEEDIEISKIGILGHSEGGMIAPLVASQRNDVAFIVMMAGPGLSGEKILLMQSELISKAYGTKEKEIAGNLKVNKKIYSILKKNPDNEKAEKEIKNVMTDYYKKNTDPKNPDQGSAAQMTNQVKTMTSPWFRTFLALDPATYLPKVKCPVLAVIGEKDLQVPPKENLEAIEKFLIFGGNSNYVVEQIPGVNHLFQTAETGLPDEYSKIEETISPGVLDMLVNWLSKR